MMHVDWARARDWLVSSFPPNMGFKDGVRRPFLKVAWVDGSSVVEGYLEAGATSAPLVEDMRARACPNNVRR